MAAETRTIAIQYEDFNPNYEWKEEQASNILLLHLPEFQKEEMKIAYANSTRVIRVTGEHPITDKKWRRFNKLFLVPDNCNIQKIQAKFQTPTLTITLPKITPSSSTATPLLEQQNPQKPQTINNHNHKHQDTTTDHSDNKKQEEILQNQEKPQIQKDDTTADSNKIKKQELNPSNIPQIPPTDDHKQEKDERKKKKQDDQKEEFEEENNNKKRKEILMLEAQEIISKKTRKEDEKKLIESYGEKAMEVKKRIMEFGKKEMSSEDKQSLINIGVAILVIAALGVYIYSSSSSKPASKD